MPVEGLDLINSPAFIWDRDTLYWLIYRLLEVVVCIAGRWRCYIVATQDRAEMADKLQTCYMQNGSNLSSSASQLASFLYGRPGPCIRRHPATCHLEGNHFFEVMQSIQHFL